MFHKISWFPNFSSILLFDLFFNSLPTILIDCVIYRDTSRPAIHQNNVQKTQFNSRASSFTSLSHLHLKIDRQHMWSQRRPRCTINNSPLECKVSLHRERRIKKDISSSSWQIKCSNASSTVERWINRKLNSQNVDMKWSEMTIKYLFTCFPF